MIELMVGIAIVAVLFAMASPSFGVWIKNSQIRTSAEAIQNGLMLARSEAVRRNTTVRFQLTSTLDNNCALSTSGSNWVVSLSRPDGARDTPSADPGLVEPAGAGHHPGARRRPRLEQRSGGGGAVDRRVQRAGARDAGSGRQRQYRHQQPLRRQLRDPRWTDALPAGRRLPGRTGAQVRPDVRPSGSQGC